LQCKKQHEISICGIFKKISVEPRGLAKKSKCCIVGCNFVN